MDALLDRVMCSSVDDEDRFVALIHAALAEGLVEPLDAFVGASFSSPSIVLSPANPRVST